MFPFDVSGSFLIFLVYVVFWDNSVCIDVCVWERMCMCLYVFVCASARVGMCVCTFV